MNSLTTISRAQVLNLYLWITKVALVKIGKSVHMDLNDMFDELESKFSSMLAANSTTTRADLIDVRLAGGLPLELGGQPRRIQLLSPQFGSDFVAGLSAVDGTWWAIKVAAISTVRILRQRERVQSVGGGDVVNDSDASAVSFADLAAEWFMPMRLRLVLAAEPAVFDCQITSIDSRFARVGIGASAVLIPLTAIVAVHATLAEVTDCG